MEDKLKQLYEQLNDAISKQDYDLAAIIKIQINDLENPTE